MHEDEKIAEAEYFYSRMVQDQNDRDAFRYNLSAFLTAARSALQYALEEAKTKAGGQQWYDSQVSSHPTVKFFKDKRDINIHVSPVNVRQHVDVNITEMALGIASVSYVVFDQQGNEKSRAAEVAPEPDRPQGSVSVTHHFFFDDWAKDEDVLTVAGEYLNAVKSVVADGKRKAIL